MKLLEKIKKYFDGPESTSESQKKCDHEWHSAGPKISKRELIESIPHCKTENYENSDYRFRVYAGGEQVWGDDNPIHHYSDISPYHINSTIQGTVCLHCGECNDKIKNEKSYWASKARQNIDANNLKADNKELAEKMWKDSECHEV